MTALLELQNVERVYGEGETQVRALDGVIAFDQRRRIRRDCRAIGFRQVNADEHLRLPR